MALACSCAGPRYEIAEVDGVVKYRGQPMKRLVVQFLPERGPSSIGETDDNGRFRLRYQEPNSSQLRDGAVVGKHRVVVADIDRPVAGQGEEPRPGRIPDRYGDLTQSPLSQEVRSGKQTIEIRLD